MLTSSTPLGLPLLIPVPPGPSHCSSEPSPPGSSVLGLLADPAQPHPHSHCCLPGPIISHSDICGGTHFPSPLVSPSPLLQPPSTTSYRRGTVGPSHTSPPARAELSDHHLLQPRWLPWWLPLAHLGSAAPGLCFHGCLLDLRNNIHPSKEIKPVNLKRNQT